MDICTNSSTFPKSHRLRKRADFVNLFNATTKISVKGFIVVWQPNQHSSTRMGITASKKVGSAVIRNRVKRLVREVFRLNTIPLPLVDINIIARREAALMDYFSVQRELEKAFRNIGASTC